MIRSCFSTWAKKAFQLPLLPHLQHVGAQGARTLEAHSFSLGASRKTRRQVGLAGARVADHQHVFPGIEVLAGGELSDQALVDRVPRSKIKIIQRLEHREPRALEAPLGGSLFAFDQLGALRQKIPVIAPLAGTARRRALPFPPGGRQPELFQVVL